MRGYLIKALAGTAAAIALSLPSTGIAKSSPDPSRPPLPDQRVHQTASRSMAPSVDSRAPFTPIVKRLLSLLTLDEKIELVHASVDPRFDETGGAGYMSGVPRLGIPARRDVDAMGIQLIQPATAIPARLGLAATFDRKALFSAGALVGSEGRALDTDLLYAPQVSLARQPNWWSNNLSYGEDPFLAGQLAIGEIDGIQSRRLMAQIKHFAFYHGQKGVEYGGPGAAQLPTVVDDQTARELYLKAFEYPILEAKPASVMASYQAFQITPVQKKAEWGTANSLALTTILRKEWDYRGVVQSDYGATHGAEALLAGLDQDFPRDGLFGWPNYFLKLKPLVDPKSSDFRPEYATALERAVAYGLYAYERFGLLTGSSGKQASAARPAIGELKAANAAMALQLAENVAVLLKNKDDVLPLSSTDLQSVAVIGPTARQLNVDGGKAEWSHGFPDRVTVSPLQALCSLKPEAHFSFEPGIDWIGEPIPQAAFGAGLVRTREHDRSERIEPQIAYDAAQPNDLKPGEAYTWTGTLNVKHKGTYYIWAQKGWTDAAFGGGPPSTSVTVDGETLALASPGVPVATYPKGVLPPFGENIGAALKLLPGAHKIVVKAAIPEKGLYALDGRPARVSVEQPVTFRLAWSSLEDSISRAVAAAKSAKVAIVFADDNKVTTDIVASLSPNEDRLISAVAAANPNTVVVLSTGGPVLTPWVDQVKAILETWYSGQEGGLSTAKLLTGQADPSGKLPITWPVDAAQTPFADHPERIDGDGKAVTFSEGLFMGYRWYDKQKVVPQFCFGCGLSYSRFAYSDLVVSTSKNGYQASLTVRNVSARAGTEIPQIYVGAPGSVTEPAQFAVRKLVGFERIALRPGQAQRVIFPISRRELSYWSSRQQKWILPIGDRVIFAGGSSRDLPLTTHFSTVAVQAQR